MFDSLDEQIQHDLKKQSSKKQRLLLWIAIAIASIVIFGGLYLGVSRLG